MLAFLVFPYLMVKETNALEIIYPNGLVVEYVGRVKKDTNSTSNDSTSTPHKQKKEFTPPELPYCRIKRADWEGVVIDYWDKWGEKHTYSWVVERPFWYSDTGASVDLVYPYRIQNAGDEDFDGLEECLVRAGKKVLTDSYYGGEGPLYIRKIRGYPFDKITIYYTTYR